MDIFINEQPLNFTLEQETDFSQVRREVMKWLADEYYVVEKCDINGTQLSIDEITSWDEKPIDEIDEIRFHVKTVAEDNFERLQIIHQYLSLLKKALETENTGVCQEISSEYKIIEKELNYILNPRGEDTQNSDIILLTKLLEQTGFFAGEMKHKDSIANAITLCGGFLSILKERMHEITNPKEELQVSIRTLASLIEPMNDIPVLLQSGKDKESMQIVLSFVETSQKMLRIYPVLKVTSDFNMQQKLASGETLEEFYFDFNAILSELKDAFNERDSVLIGDLLEYEIAPRIENLITLFKG